MNLKKDFKLKHIFLSILSSVLMLSILGLLLNVKSNVFDSVGEVLLDINMQTATANAVTTVVTFFRAVDTLGEVAVLFLATTGITLMLSSSQRIYQKIIKQESFILNTASKLLLSVIILFGVYVIVHGHLSPGGGFQGGVIIASAFLLLFLANPNTNLKHNILAFAESISGTTFILVAIIGLFKLNILFGNFLPHPVSQIGDLVSAGIIPIIYVLVGIKVGSEMTVIIEHFIKQDVEEEVENA